MSAILLRRRSAMSREVRQMQGQRILKAPCRCLLAHVLIVMVLLSASAYAQAKTDKRHKKKEKPLVQQAADNVLNPVKNALDGVGKAAGDTVDNVGSILEKSGKGMWSGVRGIWKALFGDTMKRKPKEAHEKKAEGAGAQKPGKQ